MSIYTNYIIVQIWGIDFTPKMGYYILVPQICTKQYIILWVQYAVQRVNVPKVGESAQVSSIKKNKVH